MKQHPRIKRMGHVAIQVTDLERSLAFYRDTLGLQSKWAGDDDWAQVCVGSDDLSLIRKQAAVHPPHLGFRTNSREDLIKLHAELRAQQVTVEEIKLHRDATESFYFRDPDGNWLEALWDPSEKSS
jgi:catechol 2,3-dioxygenase-like lactoylglutathione lyase family enzyme